MMYIVKPVVCDYGVYEETDDGEQLIVICNSLSNAELITDILNTDLKNTKYAVTKSSKIDEAIEEINNAEVEVDFMNEHASAFNSGLFKALEILKSNIGE